MTTPSLEALINELIDQRLRQMQTAYPAEVVSYNSTDSTATVRPLFVEAWRGPADERVVETPENADDGDVENVIVAFPRMGSFRVAFPIAAGDTGLVVCTKYSLDRFRSDGGQSDPGDIRKFTMNGSVFFPVNLTPDGSALDASQGDGDTDIYAGAGGASDYVALKKDVDDIKTMIDEIKADYNSHVHVTDAVVGGGGAVGTLDPPLKQVSATYTPTYSKNFKVESN